MKSSQKRWILAAHAFGRPAALGAWAAGVLAAAGCSSNLVDVDRRVDELVGTRSAQLGTTSPSRHSGDPDAVTPSSIKKELATTNPQAGELSYRPADESRDVAAKLQGFAEGQIGVDGHRPEHAVEIDLAEALRVAQHSGREYLSAEEDYIISAIQLLIQRHLWGPRLFNDTSVGVFGQGTQGDFQHALSVINTLKATQQLPSGGSVEAKWITQATDQLRSQATQAYVQSSELVLSGTVPLLRGAGSVAQEGLIQAERNLVYRARAFERFRRQYLVSIATDYFNLLQQQQQIANQERQLKSLRQFLESTAARVAAGRVREFERNIAENQVLTATSSLAGQRENLILALDRFKVRLGMGTETALAVKPLAFDLSDPSVSLDEASRLALLYRLDLQSQRDQLDDQGRQVANARNALLPDLNLNASAGVPTPSNRGVGTLRFNPEDLNYSAGATLSLPLDREIERLQLKQAMIGLEAAKRNYEQSRDNIVVSVRGALRTVELARFQLNLAEQQVKINQRRLEEQKLRIDQVDSQKIIDSENQLLTAENARDAAKTDLRTAILNYLLATDQMRVKADGTFEPLPGMNVGN